VLLKKGRWYNPLLWIRNYLSNNIQKIKWIKPLIITYTSLTIAFFSFNFVKIKEKSYKYKNSTIIINNNVINDISNKPYIDSVINIGLNNLNISGINVIVKEFNNNSNNTNYLGYVKKYNDNDYIIWIDKMTKDKIILILSHELIHIKQYHTKQLMIKNSNVFWNNQIVYINDYDDYYQRPWENEAHYNEKKLYYFIKSKLNE
jgi:hypothetical protein